MNANYQNAINNLIILQKFNTDPNNFKLAVYKGRQYFLIPQQSHFATKIWYLFLEHILGVVKTDKASIKALKASEAQIQSNVIFLIKKLSENFEGSSEEIFERQNKELKKIKSTNQDLFDKNFSYEQTLKILRNQMYEKTTEIAALKEQLEKLESENKKLHDKLKQFEKNKEEFTHLKSEYKGEDEHLLAELAEKKIELAQLKEQFEKMKDPESSFSLNALRSQGEKQWNRLDALLRTKRHKSPYIEELFRLIIKHEGNDRYYSTLWERLKTEKIKL